MTLSPCISIGYKMKIPAKIYVWFSIFYNHFILFRVDLFEYSRKLGVWGNIFLEGILI
jgi:hypothetical protein